MQGSTEKELTMNNKSTLQWLRAYGLARLEAQISIMINISSWLWCIPEEKGCILFKLVLRREWIIPSWWWRGLKKQMHTLFPFKLVKTAGDTRAQGLGEKVVRVMSLRTGNVPRVSQGTGWEIKGITGWGDNYLIRSRAVKRWPLPPRLLSLRNHKQLSQCFLLGWVMQNLLASSKIRSILSTDSSVFNVCDFLWKFLYNRVFQHGFRTVISNWGWVHTHTHVHTHPTQPTYHTILYCTIPYYAILYHTILYHTIPIIPYHTTPYHTIPYDTTPYLGTLEEVLLAFSG